MKYLCKNINNMIIGIKLIIDPEANRPHLVPYLHTAKLVSPTFKVSKSFEFTKTNAIIKSFQVVYAEKIATVAIPGQANGSIILKKILISPDPSIIADSLILSGIASNVFFNI